MGGYQIGNTGARQRALGQHFDVTPRPQQMRQRRSEHRMVVDDQHPDCPRGTRPVLRLT